MKKASSYLNLISIVIPLLVLAGWQYDIDFFKRPIPGSVFMNPVTAMGLLLTGLSFLILTSQRLQKFHSVAKGIAGFVLLVAVARLAFAVGGYQLPVQPLFFRHQVDAASGYGAINIISPNALISILLFGTSLFLFRSEKIILRKVANYLAMVVLLIGMFSLIGYLYHVKEYYSVPSFYPMAIHTAACFTCLALAILFANNDVGFMVVLSNPNIAGKIARLLVPATVVVPVILGYLWVYAQDYLSITGGFGVSLLIIGFIAVFFSLIWYVSVALNQGDIARVASEKELMEKNETLRITDERLMLATEGTAAGIWDWMDINRDEEWWSARFYELLGYSNNEIAASANTFREIMHPDDFKRIAKKLDAHFKQNSRFEIEARLKTKSGLYKWFLGTGQVLRNSWGEAVRMVGSIIDIDEQKRTRDIIEQQAAQIKMLPDGIISYSAGMKFADLNTGAETMFDLKREDVTGKDMSAFLEFSLPPGQQFSSLGLQAFYRGEIQISNRISGKTVNVLVTIKRLENASGAEPLFIAIFTDLSPLRINEELKRALKSLETNNQYLEQFAYISAHDIKAPIITISGLTDLMLKSNAVKDEHLEVLKMLTNSVKQIQRTNHSLNNILKLRKNLMAKDYVNDQAFSLRTIIEDVKIGVQHDIEVTGATLHINLHDMADVPFQYVYIKSIFYNLINNAIKYRDGDRPLVIHVEVLRTSGSKIRFIIEDNGLGIDLKKNMGKMFGIFKRFHTHVEGTGVGLHIVKSIVDEYNGTIDVESSPNEGTRFVIEFGDNILA